MTRHRIIAVAFDDPGQRAAIAQWIGGVLGTGDRDLVVGPSGIRLYVRLRSTDPLRPPDHEIGSVLRQHRTSGPSSIAAAAVDSELCTRAAEPHRTALLDVMLDWLLVRAHRRIVGVTEIQSEFVLDRLRDAVSRRPDLLGGHVAWFARSDADGRTDYIRTLMAYFDHGGDVGAAAESLFMHPNTVRYRLRRMQDLTGLRLDDPVDRFVAELQLRVLRPSPGRGALRTGTPSAGPGGDGTSEEFRA